MYNGSEFFWLNGRKEAAMEIESMGRVIVPAKLENAGELYMAEVGVITKNEVHRLEEAEALVDTGSTHLSMPKSKLKELGFKKHYGTAQMRTAKGVARLR